MFRLHEERLLIGMIALLALSACSLMAPASPGQPATTPISVTTFTPSSQTAIPGTASGPTPAGGWIQITTPSAPAPLSQAVEDTATSAAPTLAPVTSKTLNVFAKLGSIPQALIDDFTRAYNVRVNYATYTTSGDYMSKLETGASGYDVVIADDYSVQILIKQDLLVPIDLSQIPNIVNVDPRFLNLDYDPKNKFTIPYQWGTVGLAVNSGKVMRPINSWEDLWDPAFKDRVVLLDDEREDIGMALLVLGFDKNSTDPAQLDQARQKLLDLLPNVNQFNSDSSKTALLSGDAYVGQTWSGEAVMAHRQNPSIQYLCPREGCGIWFDNLGVPKGAGHKDAALAFINFVLKSEESILLTKTLPFSNPNRAALSYLQQNDPGGYQAYMDYQATNPPADDIQNAHPIRDVGDAITLWNQIWTAVRGK